MLIRTKDQEQETSGASSPHEAHSLCLLSAFSVRAGRLYETGKPHGKNRLRRRHSSHGIPYLNSKIMQNYVFCVNINCMLINIK